jgi:hypothetical protein
MVKANGRGDRGSLKDSFGHALEADPLPLHRGHQLDEMLERPPQPIEPPTAKARWLALIFSSGRPASSVA